MILGLLALSVVFFSACKKDDHLHDNHNDHQVTPPIIDTTNTAITDSIIPPGHLVFVADEKNGAVSVIRPSQGKRIRSIPLSPSGSVDDMLMPHNVQVAPDGRSVWVTGVGMKSGAMEQMIIIDPITNTIIKKIDVGKSLHLAHVVFDDASKNAFVTASDFGLLIQIDAVNYTEVKRINLGFGIGPHGLRYYKGKLYIACMNAKSMKIVDVETSSITDVPLGGTAIQTAVSPNGKYVFVSLYDTREVIKYDLQSGQVLRIPLPQSSQGPIQLYPTPDSKQLYVCDQGAEYSRPVSDEVYVLDIEEAKVLATLKSGRGAHGVVISNDGKTAYVTNSGEQSVSIIDVASRKLRSKIPVGAGPNGISYWFESGGMP